MTATERVEFEPAFVLHGRAYRETSELLDVFTQGHGRISLVARGMRRPKAGLRGIVRAFQPLAVSWFGRGGGLMTLRTAEASAPPIALQGDALMSGFYVNELLLRFLHRGDPHPGLFAAYSETIAGLAAACSPDAPLRRFELRLLAEVGYGLNLDRDAASGEPLNPAGRYAYIVEHGPVPAAGSSAAEVIYAGADLLAIGRGDFTAGQCLQSARRLLRDVLDHHLGGKPLRTRTVFSALKR
jgi:DNA repair protein RecO (recombination protein O)